MATEQNVIDDMTTAGTAVASALTAAQGIQAAAAGIDVGMTQLQTFFTNLKATGLLTQAQIDALNAIEQQIIQNTAAITAALQAAGLSLQSAAQKQSVIST